jgi:hypothetical protein
LPADKPFQRRDPGLILLKKIRPGRVFVKGAGLILLNPDPDQVSTDVVALGEPTQGLAGQEFPSDLALNSMLCVRRLAIGFHPSKARLDGQFFLVQPSGPRGPLPPWPLILAAYKPFRSKPACGLQELLFLRHPS